MRYGKRYRLKNPTSFDDEYGKGFYFVDPVKGVTDDMYVGDCWIVNEYNVVHPGYLSCPVPIRRDDVEEEDASNPDQYDAGYGRLLGLDWDAGRSARDVLKLFDPTGKTHGEVVAWVANALQGAYNRGFQDGQKDTL